MADKIYSMQTMGAKGGGLEGPAAPLAVGSM